MGAEISGELPNGVRYTFAAPDGYNGGTEVWLIVRTGFLHERHGETGVSHLIEHLGFAGLPSYPDRSIWTRLAGADAGAYTSWSHTAYNFKLNDTGLTPDEAVQILSEWAGGMLLSDESINKERAVVLAESESSRKGDEETKLVRTLIGSTIRQRSAESEERDINSISGERVREFYRQHYTADRMSIVVVGKIDPGKWLAAVRSRFSGFKRSAASATSAKLEPQLGKPNSVTLIGPAPEEGLDVSAYSFVKSEVALFAEPVTVRSHAIESVASEMIIRRLQRLGVALGYPLIGGPVSRSWIDPTLKFDGLVLQSHLSGVDEFPRWAENVAEILRQLKVEGFTADELAVAKAATRIPELQSALSNENRTKYAFIGSHFWQTPRSPWPTREYAAGVFDDIGLGDVNEFVRNRISLEKDLHIVVRGNLEGQTWERLRRKALVSLASGSEETQHSLAALRPQRLLESLSEPGRPMGQPRVVEVAPNISLLTTGPGIPFYLVQSPTVTELGGVTLVALSEGSGLRARGDKFEDYEQLSAGVRVVPRNIEADAADLYFDVMGLESSLRFAPAYARLNIVGNAERLEAIFDAMRAATAKSDVTITLRNPATALPPRPSPAALSDAERVDVSEATGAFSKLYSDFRPSAFFLIGNFDQNSAVALATKQLSDVIPAPRNDSAKALNDGSIADDHIVATTTTTRDGETIRTYRALRSLDERERIALSTLGVVANNRMISEIKNRLGLAYYVGAGVGVGAQADISGRYLVQFNLQFTANDEVRAIIIPVVDRIFSDLLNGGFSEAEFLAAKKEQAELFQKESVSRNDLTDRAVRAYIYGNSVGQISDPAKDLQDLNIEDIKYVARGTFDQTK